MYVIYVHKCQNKQGRAEALDRAVQRIKHVVAVVSGRFPARCFTAVIFPEYFILVPLSYLNNQEYLVASYLHCSEASVKGKVFY